MMPAHPPHFGQNIQPPTPTAAGAATGWGTWVGSAPNGPAYASPVPRSPFSLETGKDDDAGLFQDARTGFSHLLPGRPSLGRPRPGEPPADATVHLQDAPITLRYKLEPPTVRASSAGELARLTAERFACWRAQAPVNVEFANPTWLLAWGAEAAAVATYDVARAAGSHPPPPSGQAQPRQAQPAREDLFVLVRQGMVYIVTWTYPRGFTDDPAYASFASVAEATMIWDPLRWEQRGRVWPESAFVGPGIYAPPKPKHAESARWLSSLPLSDDERARVLGVLSDLIGNAGAPWVALRPDGLERHRSAVLSSLRHPELRSFVDGAFSDVRTAHDLRGLAVLLGRALDRRPSSRPEPSMRTQMSR